MIAVGHRDVRFRKLCAMRWENSHLRLPRPYGSVRPAGARSSSAELTAKPGTTRWRGIVSRCWCLKPTARCGSVSRWWTGGTAALGTML